MSTQLTPLSCQFITNRKLRCKAKQKPKSKYCPRHTKAVFNRDNKIESPGIKQRMTNLMPTLNRETYNAIMDGYDTLSLNEMAQVYGPLIFARMCELALNGQTEDTQLKAGAFVSDKIYGKAVQLIQIDAKVAHQVLEIIRIPELLPQKIIELDANGDPILVESEESLLQQEIIKQLTNTMPDHNEPALITSRKE